MHTVDYCQSDTKMDFVNFEKNDAIITKQKQKIVNKEQKPKQ